MLRPLSVLPILMFCLELYAVDENKFASSLYISDLFFQAQGSVHEPATGGMDVPLGRIAVKSRLVDWFDLHVSVGSSSILYRPQWAPTQTNSLALLAAEGVVHTFLGDFYAGQFITPWGLDGTTDVADLWLPRTLLYEQGGFPLYDVGAGFKTSSGGFYMNVALHNGEGAGTTNLDNRVFLTGQWGYHGAAHMNLGLSATAGRLAAPLVSQENRVRGANAFFGFNIFGLGLQVEGSVFDFVPVSVGESGKSTTLAWHADLEHPITSDHLNLIYRFEQYNPNTRASANILSRSYVGGEYHSKDSVSRLFVFLIKNNESQQETPNDEVRVVWRLTPVSVE